MTAMEKLRKLRGNTGDATTIGLSDDLLTACLPQYPLLGEAIDLADKAYDNLSAANKELAKKNEKDVCQILQERIVNFYPEAQVNPYTALAAKGPWIITLHGAVLHDSGGYGMLGFGHSPSNVLAAMNGDQVMANVMTPSLHHKEVTDLLVREIGHARQDQPFQHFLFMNSGSESVTVALRIADLNAKTMTDKGGRHSGKTIKILAHRGGFHGRTDRPAQASDSTMSACQELASFRDRKNLLVVEPNNTAMLKEVFAEAQQKNVFIEMVLMEPVMGEGNPGVAITPEYYAEARRLTKEHGSLFLIDSIQAGLRATGQLSIVDYPGFTELDPPDMETYSKALNAGQYPLSVLALTKEASALYKRGVYGNTMTGNPRALEVAAAVLKQLSPEVRQNIVARGAEFISKFQELGQEFPEVVTGVTGTGLLCAIHLKEDGYKVVGFSGVETYLRHQGIGVIHGGKNALRFTPHFLITSAEITMIVDHIREALKRGPVYR